LAFFLCFPFLGFFALLLVLHMGSYWWSVICSSLPSIVSLDTKPKYSWWYALSSEFPRITCTSPSGMLIREWKESSVDVSFSELDSESPSSQFITGVVDVDVPRTPVVRTGVVLRNPVSGLGFSSIRKSCSCAFPLATFLRCFLSSEVSSPRCPGAELDHFRFARMTISVLASASKTFRLLWSGLKLPGPSDLQSLGSSCFIPGHWTSIPGPSDLQSLSSSCFIPGDWTSIPGPSDLQSLGSSCFIPGDWTSIPGSSDLQHYGRVVLPGE